MNVNSTNQELVKSIEQIRLKILASEDVTLIVNLIEETIDKVRTINPVDISYGSKVQKTREDLKKGQITSLEFYVANLSQGNYNNIKSILANVSLTITGLLITIFHLTLDEIQSLM